MLNIHLQRNLPDALKPKKIAIKDYSGAVQKAVDSK
jgi:hypothetical protein